MRKREKKKRKKRKKAKKKFGPTHRVDDGPVDKLLEARRIHGFVELRGRRPRERVLRERLGRGHGLVERDDGRLDERRRLLLVDVRDLVLDLAVEALGRVVGALVDAVSDLVPRHLRVVEAVGRLRDLVGERLADRGEHVLRGLGHRGEHLGRGVGRGLGEGVGLSGSLGGRSGGLGLSGGLLLLERGLARGLGLGLGHGLALFFLCFFFFVKKGVEVEKEESFLACFPSSSV